MCGSLWSESRYLVQNFEGMAVDDIRESWDGPSSVWDMRDMSWAPHVRTSPEALITTDGYKEGEPERRSVDSAGWWVPLTHQNVKIHERTVWKRQMNQQVIIAKMGHTQNFVKLMIRGSTGIMSLSKQSVSKGLEGKEAA